MPINPPTLQGGLSQLHLQEPGFEGRNGKGAPTRFPQSRAADTPRRLRLQCPGGDSGQEHFDARFLGPQPGVSPSLCLPPGPHGGQRRGTPSRWPHWDPGCGPPTRPLGHSAQRSQVFRRVPPAPLPAPPTRAAVEPSCSQDAGSARKPGTWMQRSAPPRAAKTQEQGPPRPSAPLFLSVVQGDHVAGRHLLWGSAFPLSHSFIEQLTS